MNLFQLPYLTHLLVRDYLAPMALFLWGFAWLTLSVLIFLVGRLLPHAQPRTIVLRPRTRSPRIQSIPVSPVPTPPELIPETPAETIISAESRASASEPQLISLPPLSPPLERPRPKKRWSLSAHLSQRRPVPSPQLSLLSEGSSTLVGSPQSPNFFPELPVIESINATQDPSVEQSSPRTTPGSSPRNGRGVRLPSVNVFKAFSRKLSSKQKSELSTSPISSSPQTLVDSPLPRVDSPVCDDEKSASQPRRRATIDEGPRQARPGHLLHQRSPSAPGEVFTTTFVNSFRLRSRRAKTPPVLAIATDQREPVPPSPSPQRTSAPRRMLTTSPLPRPLLRRSLRHLSYPPQAGARPSCPARSRTRRPTSCRHQYPVLPLA
ncbi:hypothetical protein PYCCODRAFT_637732 [Trametes coccinea BRFM310]|uniref:Uncharacterized protein n=1 Tax=Trametes coccinea (strain BRFM310) TaxID=1353009 RepID=A0A1Y2IJN3_TRAC3|nr:hypothetical protein PYCCODRAFT_637732 [Trametes coccinea BRFM310]